MSLFRNITPVQITRVKNDGLALIGYEHAQRPLFRLLGTPEAHKKHVLTTLGAHMPPEHIVVREYLDWFDRYLGRTQVRL